MLAIVVQPVVLDERNLILIVQMSQPFFVNILIDFRIEPFLDLIHIFLMEIELVQGLLKDEGLCILQVDLEVKLIDEWLEDALFAYSVEMIRVVEQREQLVVDVVALAPQLRLADVAEATLVAMSTALSDVDDILSTFSSSLIGDGGRDHDLVGVGDRADVSSNLCLHGLLDMHLDNLIRLVIVLDRMFNRHADRKSTRLNSSHSQQSRMPSSA